MPKFFCILFFFICGKFLSAQTITVSNATQLQQVLQTVQPGQTIFLNDGLYVRPGGFYSSAGRHGTEAQPITITGSKNAILSSGTINTGYAFALKGNNYWIIKGFTVYNAKNGVMIDSSKHVIVDDIYSHYMGQTGIHFRTYTSYSTIKNCYIDTMGLIYDGIGEGIYVGSANGNWMEVTGGVPDTCNYNQILNNSFGNSVTSENIDIKEGTKYGIVRGNILNGTGLTNNNGGDSWIDVKGNYWLIENNTGTFTTRDGFQTHVTYPGWGSYNTFKNNTINVSGATGYGINIQLSGSQGTSTGNVVCNNNTVVGRPLTNVTPQACATLAAKIIYFKMDEKAQTLKFSWLLANTQNTASLSLEYAADNADFKLLNKWDVVSENVFRHSVSLPANNTFYRLKITEKDGEVNYSNILNFNGNNKEYTFYKSGNQVNIFNPFSLKSVVVYSLDGKLLDKKALLAGNNTLNFNYSFPFVLAIFGNSKLPEKKKIFF